VFPATDAAAFQSALARALEALRGDRTELQLHIAARIGGYTYAQATSGLQSAMDQALTSP
jgi:hypothetical protein